MSTCLTLASDQALLLMHSLRSDQKTGMPGKLSSMSNKRQNGKLLKVTIRACPETYHICYLNSHAYLLAHKICTFASRTSALLKRVHDLHGHTSFHRESQRLIDSIHQRATKDTASCGRMAPSPTKLFRETHPGKKLTPPVYREVGAA